MTTLAYLLGAVSTPRGFLHKLKLCLLLSLVSTGSLVKMNILAVGADVTVIARLEIKESSWSRLY